MTDIHVYRAFRNELEKLAISAGTTLSLLQQRAAQGARIAPALMHGAEQAAASGLAHTPAAARRTALGAGEAVRAQQASHAMLQNPVTQGMRSRVLGAYERATAPGREGGPLGALGVRNSAAKPLPGHYDYGATGVAGSFSPYSQSHIDSMMGTATMQDPKGLMAPTGRERSIMHATPPMGASNQTAVNPHAPTQIAPSADRTQVGLVGGRAIGHGIVQSPTALDTAPGTVVRRRVAA